MHFKETSIQINDDKPCKRIQTGGGYIAKHVREFNQRSLQYIEDHKGCRFPPSFYLKEDSTCQWAEKMEGLLTSPSVKILVGYNPIVHLQLLGLEKSEYEQIIDNPAAATYENSVIVINNNKRWVMASVVSDETDHASIGMELNKLDGILKTIYHSNLNRIKNEYIAIVGILVCPNIDSRSKLGSYQQIRRDSDQLFITKTEWNSDKDLKQWMNFFAVKIKSEIQNNCSGIPLFISISKFGLTFLEIDRSDMLVMFVLESQNKNPTAYQYLLTQVR